MISLNGLYTTLRGAIKELTGVEVYRNTSSKQEVVNAKWLFIKVVYHLFENKGEKLLLINKPKQTELALELGYSTKESIYFLLHKYNPAGDKINTQLNILKNLFVEYTNLKISKERLKEMLLEEKFTLTDVIDCVIELNGLIGVGLITLEDGIKEYITNKNKYNGL